jgi:hypothetical protein
MRNLIVLAKVIVGVDATVDGIIERISTVRDLNDLVGSAQSGRGLLHWASYYDAWLMGDDLDLKNLQLQTEPVAPGIVEISLAEETWGGVERALSPKHQWSEQDGLVWHLWQAFDVFRQSNSGARLFFGREVLGASLDDSEVLGGHTTNGWS